jgi:bifunctional non-homologous end joining protein LigD
VSEPLQEYQCKRDFSRTPEPAGEAGRGTQGNLYVMHMHAASHDHFDLRLEHQGVLKSWALPKGPSLEPGEKRLAVEVEDHPLEYGSFEGVIPKGQYGGGTVMLWDHGSWQPNGKHDDNHLDFVLDGGKLKGAWTLIRTGGHGKRAKPGKSWLLIKRSDGRRRRLQPDDHSIVSGRTMAQIARDRDRVWGSDGARSGEQERPAPPRPAALDGARKQALAGEIRPQLATLVGSAPDGDDWLHEIKFDGYRVMARIVDGRVCLHTRNGHDWTARFGGLAEALAAVPARRAVLDGEVAVLDANGATSFRALQEALGGAGRGDFVYLLFDLLHLDGHDLRTVPQLARKQALAQLLAAGGFGAEGAVRYSDHIVGHGPEFHAQACQLGLEGIISKRAGAGYRSGRGRQWLKVKCTDQQEFVVGGFTPPGGARTGFGALLLGGHDEQGRLIYAGRVGTGFSSRQLEQLHRRLRKIEVAESPFADDVGGARRVHWVEPTMVVEVEFTERTRDGRLRHPSFRGLRDDRQPDEIELSARLESTDPASPAESAESAQPARRAVPGEARVAGVRLSNPDRVMFPESGITKLDLALYYESIQDWILPQIANRALSLLRCPQGWQGECFFQKHLGPNQARAVPRIGFRESRGIKEYSYVRSIADLVALVQAGVLELHPFGSQVDDIEHPDLIVFDLDPAPGLAWADVLHATRGLRARIEALGLACFLRTTGGKGLHIVVPLKPSADWDQVKRFAQAVAEQHARDEPARFTTNMSKARRSGKIFIDYLRNSRGATAIASYSVRAREGAPVAVPMRWDELGPALRADRYRVHNLRRRLSALKEDPWQDFIAARRPLDRRLRRAVGMDD